MPPSGHRQGRNQPGGPQAQEEQGGGTRLRMETGTQPEMRPKKQVHRGLNACVRQNEMR